MTTIDIKASSVQMIVDAGIRHGLSGRPLKRFVKRKLDKIMKKVIKSNDSR